MSEPELHDYRMVVVFNVKAEDEADAVRKFSRPEERPDGWLNLVERIEVDEQS